ncbi:hypothetical protein [Sandarakinorhabdus sp.]|uniref:hypothetical protein n=1 Tax=Sandarakinorhabdus sp. TaxID=1916663 RepID=UPI00286D933E|nr:hypothetical protein [Sandarakinorhabdus sp.]
MAFLDPPDAQARRTRYWVAGGAVAATAIIMIGFLIESRYGYLPPDPILIYAQSWKGDRSRADAIADAAATKSARETRLAQSRAYIATLKGEARVDAQKQYDAYVAGNGFRREIPYVAVAPSVEALVKVRESAAPAEPPVE